MKDSLIILSFFCAGILVGASNVELSFIASEQSTLYALWVLLFLVGFSTGIDSETWNRLRKNKLRSIALPFISLMGTIVAAAILSFVLNGLSMKQSVAVGAGMGYYSLSSVMLSKLDGESLGAIALLANMFRESLTLLLAPLIVKVFGELPLIATGGVTSMDTTLPIVTRYAGAEYSMISIFHGFVLTAAVPVIISFVYAL